MHAERDKSPVGLSHHKMVPELSAFSESNVCFCLEKKLQNLGGILSIKKNLKSFAVKLNCYCCRRLIIQIIIYFVS